jgi:hypothetical protein
MANNTLDNTIKTINNIETLRELKKEFNVICESHEKHLQAIEESKNINNKSFLFIKESFNNFSEKLFRTKEGRKLMNRYINEHKKNKDLQKMFFIYENILSANKNLNLDKLLDEMKTMVGNIDEKSLDKGIKNLNKLLQEAYVEIGIDSSDLLSKHDGRILDESVKYIVTNSKKLDNLTRYNICLNEIKKFIDNNEVISPKFENEISTPEDVLREFNEKFSEQTLGKENYELLMEIKNAYDKELIFEKYKNECLNTINEAINKNEKQDICNQLFEFKTKITKKEYNPYTLGTDVVNFIELQKTIKE